MKQKIMIVIALMTTQIALAADATMEELRALAAIQHAQIAALQEQLNAPRFIGTADLPIDFHDMVGPDWKRLQFGWGQTHATDFEGYMEPGRKPQARLCFMWSDECTAGAFSIKLAPGAGAGDVSPQDARRPVYSADGFGYTWSEHQLYHTRCGPWVDAKPILDQCSGGWGGTCQLMIKRDQQLCRTTIKKGHIEWRSVPGPSR